MRRLLIFSLLALLSLIPGSHAASPASAVSYSIFSSPTAGIDIDAFLAWEEIPYDRAGFYPVQIRIANMSKRDGTWTVESISTAGNYYSDNNLKRIESLSVPAGDTRTFQLLCPLSKGESYCDLQLSITGPGIGNDDLAYFSRNSRSRRGGNLSHFGGISELLYQDIGNKLEGRINSLNENIKYIAITPSIAPENWRAYLTFDTLYFSQSEWEKLSPGARRAILDWVMSGGQLRILVGNHPMTTALSDIPSGTRTRTVGIGEIALFQGDTARIKQDIDQTKTITKMNRGVKQSEEQIALFDSGFDAFFNFRFKPENKLSNAFDETLEQSQVAAAFSQTQNKIHNESNYFEDSIILDPVNFTLIIISVIAFGIIVGPVNFFVLAKGRNRWRIFITIPLISLIFCILIVGSIILSDGFGGDGKISRLVIIDPVRKAKFYVQDELSVTGILMSGRFEIPETATIEHRGAKLAETPMDTSGTFVQNEKRFSGDYYESRRLQYNRLTDVQPTREAMILQGSSDAPELVSNLQAHCSEVFYLDQKGQFWKVDGLGVGRSAKAVKSSSAEFNQWWRQQKLIGGAQWLYADYRGFAGRPGWFYATANPIKDAFADPLEGINWQDHQTIIAGPLVDKESI